MTTTAAMASFLSWKRDLVGHSADDVFMLSTPCTFDVGVCETWLALVTGTPAYVPPPGARHDPAQLHAELLRSNTSIMHFVPRVMMLFLAGAPHVPLPRLRLVEIAGEAATMDHRRALTAAFGPVQLLNIYGPTECGEVRYFDCKDDSDCASHGFPLGVPGPRVAAAVVDPADVKVPAHPCL